MNKKRTEFLERNLDREIKDYIFNKDLLANEFEYYPYKQYVKNKLINGVMVLPRVNGEWTEDKLWFVSLNDAKFFVKWYNENHKIEAILTQID